MVSVGILAGGKSNRMGQDKAFLEIDGQALISRVIERVAGLTNDLFICTNTPDLYASFGLRTIADVYPNKAALGGIYSVIQAAHFPHVLVVACDMPYLNTNLLHYLTGLAGTADVVVPLIQPPQPETLHAVYSKPCLPHIEARIKSNKLRIVGFFEDVLVHYVERETIAQFDPEFKSFINLNTPIEWQKFVRESSPHN